MSKIRKFVFALLFTLILADTISCSGENERKSEVEDSNTETASEIDGAELLSTIIPVEGEYGEISNISVSQKKIIIYIIDTTKNSILPITTTIDSENELKILDVTEAVLLALSDNFENIEIDSIKEDKKSVTVDFKAKDKKMPFGKDGAESEELILDCISYSIFDNFSNLKRIYFTVNGEAYNSNKIKLSEKKPFLVNE